MGEERGPLFLSSPLFSLRQKDLIPLSRVSNARGIFFRCLIRHRRRESEGMNTVIEVEVFLCFFGTDRGENWEKSLLVSLSAAESVSRTREKWKGRKKAGEIFDASIPGKKREWSQKRVQQPFGGFWWGKKGLMEYGFFLSTVISPFFARLAVYPGISRHLFSSSNAAAKTGETRGRRGGTNSWLDLSHATVSGGGNSTYI